MELIALFPHLHTFFVVAFILFCVVALANLIDCIDAVITGRECGQKLESARLRHALYKLAKYWLFLLMALLVDFVGVIGLYQLPYIMMCVTAAMLFIEGRSMFEHAKRRKDKTAKIPETLRDIAEYVGDDKVKEIIIDIFTRKFSPS